MKKLLLSLLAMVSGYLVQAQPSPIYTENFDAPPPAVVNCASPVPCPNVWFLDTLNFSAPNSYRDTVPNGAGGTFSYFETNPFSTLGNNYVALEFKHICKIPAVNRASIEISADGGVTWDTLKATEYFGTSTVFPLPTINYYFNAGSYGSAGGWFPGNATQIPDSSWWRTERFNLSAYAANAADVRLRFKLTNYLGTGNALNYGWVVDDINVQEAPSAPPELTILTPYPQGNMLNLGPYTINVNIIDPTGVQGICAANLYYSINGVPQPYISMTNVAGSQWQGILPAMLDSQTVCYYMEAYNCIDNVYGYYPYSFIFLNPGDGFSVPGGTICFLATSGIHYPYNEQFTNTPGLWTASSSSGSSWQLGYPTQGLTNYPFSIPQCWDVELNSAYQPLTETYLYSPIFRLTNGLTTNMRLSFWQNRNTDDGSSGDGFRIDYRLNGAGAWSALGTVGDLDATNWYTDASLSASGGLPAWTGSTNGFYEKSTYMLANLNGVSGDLEIRYAFNSDNFVEIDGVSIDDFSMVIPPAQDAALTAILKPAGSSPAGIPDSVKIRIRNVGSQPISNFQVAYIDYGHVPATPVVETVTATILPAATLVYAFTTLDSVPTGAYSVCAYTMLASDGDRSNDTICKQSNGVPLITLPYVDNFDVPPSVWYDSSDATTTTKWELGTPANGLVTGAYSNPNAWGIGLTADYSNNAYSVLTSPIFNFTNKAFVTLKFYQNYFTDQFGDGVRMEYTTDGTAWQILDTAGNLQYQNWYNDAFISSSGLPGWNNFSNGWRRTQMVLTQLDSAGPNVQFRFIFTSNAFTIRDGHSIDDFSLRAASPLDAGVDTVMKPGIQTIEGDLVSVKIRIKNFGLTPLSTCSVGYSVNGVPQAVEVWTGSLSIYDTDTFTFATQFTSPGGYYDVCGYTLLAGDGDGSNDTTCKPVFGLSRRTISFSDAFDVGPQLWFATTNDIGTKWELGPPNYGVTNSAHSPPNAWDTNLDTAYGNNCEAILYSPLFDFTGQNNVRLSFWQNRRCETGWDGTRLEYSRNYGASWSRIDSAQNFNVNNWYNDTSLNSTLLPAWTGASNGWVESGMVVRQLNNIGPDVQFRFVFSADGIIVQDGFSIDDFNLLRAPDYDVASVAIVTPRGIGVSGMVDSIRVNLYNAGFLPITAMNLVYTVNGGPPVTVPWTGNLLPGSYDTITVDDLTIPLHAFNLCFHADLINDADHTNDTICGSYYGAPSYNLTYYDEFESSQQEFFPYGANNQWEWGTPASTVINSACSPQFCWKTKRVGNPIPRTNDYLYTPFFNFNNAYKARLNFCHNWNTDNFSDGGRIEFSLDTGRTWFVLGSTTDTNATNWYTDNSIFATQKAAWEGTSNGWTTSSYYLIAFSYWQGLVQFRFNYASDNFSPNLDGWAVDNFQLFNPLTIDIAPVGTNPLPNPFVINGNQTITTVIENKGSFDIHKFKVSLIVDGTHIVTDQVNLPSALVTNATTPHVMSQQWNPRIPTLGGHDVCIVTSMPNDIVDQDINNDTLCTFGGEFDSVTVDDNNDYCNDFDGSQNRWIPLNSYTYSLYTTDWWYGFPLKTFINAPYSGDVAWATKLDSNYDVVDSSSLYTPAFKVDSVGCYELSFYHIYKTEPLQDGGVVEYTINNGGSWTQLGWGFEPDWYNTVNVPSLSRPVTQPRSGWTGTATGWEFAVHNVKFYQPDTVVFRFRFASDNSYQDEGWAIDNFCLKKIGPCTIGIDEIGELGFSLSQSYPNPAQDAATISYAIAPKGNVRMSLMNLLGENIQTLVDETRLPGQYSVDVNTSVLAPGIYYYTMEFNDKRLVKKMVVID